MNLRRFLGSRTVLGPLLCIVALFFTGGSAFAGTWNVGYTASGSNVGDDWLQPEGLGPWPTMPPMYDGGVSFSAAGSVYAKSSGSVTAVLTWQPSYTGEAPPVTIWIKESATAQAHTFGSFDDSFVGNASNGLGSPVISDPWYEGLDQYVTSSGSRGTEIQVGGRTTITLPSVSVSAEASQDYHGPVDALVSYKVEVTSLLLTITRSIDGGPFLPIRATNNNDRALPGQKIVLSVSVTGGTPTSWQWNIYPTTFKNYDPNAPLVGANPQLTQLAPGDLTGSQVQFYWASSGGNARDVKCTVTVNGTSYAVQSAVTVVKPTVTWIITEGSVGLYAADPNDPNSFNAISLGPDADSDRGIDWNGSIVTIPTEFGVGKWNFVNLVTPSRYRWAATYREKWSSNDLIGLDSRFPYAGRETDTGMVLDTGDSPGQSIDGDTVKVVIGSDTDSLKSEKFETYLMFLPPGVDSRYVPLERITWFWKGKAEATVLPTGDINWGLSNQGGPGTSGRQETSAHPTWTRVNTGADPWVRY